MLSCTGLTALAVPCKRNVKKVIVWQPNYNQVECLCNQHYSKVAKALTLDDRWLVETVLD